MKTRYLLPALIVLSFGCNAEKASSRRREASPTIEVPSRVQLPAPEAQSYPAPTYAAEFSVVDVVVIESNQLGHPPNWARVSTADGRTFLLDTWQPIGKRMRYTIQNR